MLMVLIQWCYIAATAFVTGFAALAPFQKKGGYKIRYMTSCMMAGLLVQNVYAQYFSLFAGVGLWANALMAVFDIIVLAVCRRKLLSFVKESCEQAGKGRLALCAVLTLLFAYGSSRGYMHYDTGLYHAQSIRWIEEYGVVPGLANLHSRFGYNSAAFALCALFGGAGLAKYPIHCVQGFFALLCAVKCTALLELPRRRQVRISDFLYAGCVFYLVAVFRELVAPASDYFAMLILFFVTMCWTELLERREKEILPYALLSLYLVYAATVKLSTAVLLVLVLQPAVWLIRQRSWKQIAGYIGLGVVIAFPYLARNVLISGWLFYPFTFFDLFPVDWKISKGYADSDAAEIRVYAKEIFDVYQKDMPFREWFPAWLSAQDRLDQLLVLAGWLSLPVGAVMLLRTAVRAAGADRRRERELFRQGGEAVSGMQRDEAVSGVQKDEVMSSGRRDEVMSGVQRDKVMSGVRKDEAVYSVRRNGRPVRLMAHMEPWAFVLLELTAVLGFLFWQFGAPLVRYGYFYVLFLPLVTFGALYVQFAGKGLGLLKKGVRGDEQEEEIAGFRLFLVILVAFLLYRGYNLCNMVLELWDQPYYIYQQDYGTYPAKTYEVDGVTVYVPTDRGQIGYDKFPSSPIVQDIELRGEGLRSGFRKRGSADGGGNP